MVKLGYMIAYVSDVGATLEFYERAFGLKRRFLHESGLYGELDTGATTLAFAGEAMIDANGLSLRVNRPNELPAAIEIAMVATDVDAAHARAVAAGALPVKSPSAKPWGQIVGYVRDPNGVLIEICSPMNA